MISFVWPWLLGALLLVVAGAAFWALRTRSGPAPEARWVANTDHLEDVPAVRRALRTYEVLRWAGVGAVVLAVVGAATLAARPADRHVTADRFGTRDIVLCLDVSGSMVPFDAAVLDTFAELVDGFSGERIALSVFNSTSRTVFPLTDDYALALEEIAAAQEALSYDIESMDPLNPLTWDGLDELLAFVEGTQGVPGQGSLIGDGLASCALLFDERDTDRSRSIILATDNDPYGSPVYSFPEAADVVAARDVQLYGLYGGAPELRGSPQNEEFTTAVRSVGGMSWFAEDPAAVSAVLEDVAAQQAAALDAEPRTVLTDRPLPWFVVLAVGLLALLVIRWRLRE